jgi:outer membrane murein-binding lipoprotein Lpp
VLSDTYILRGVFKNSLTEVKVKFDKRALRIIAPIDSNISEELTEEGTLFDSKQNENIIDISLVETKGNNEIILRIKNMINTYLINNYGAAVNFSIIKDIIDREVDVKDDEITQSIPTPLYLGLAATMLGIIFGFLAMPEINGEDDAFFTGINVLIQGVKYAMGASLTGLVLTTILSSGFYKGAKRKSLKEKNDQLSYLQAKLLPELIKAEDTGVSGLKASLDRFARVATGISDNVLIASNQTGENLILQQEMMDKFEKMDMIKVSNVNLDLFAKLDGNMKAFKKFSTYLSSMEAISSNLKDFASRTVAVDAIAGQISTSLEESKKLSQYLTSHLEKIESSGNQSLKAVDYADSHFRTAIEKLEIEINDRIKKINTSATYHESNLKEIYEGIGKSLDKVITAHITEFTKSYAEAVPQFKQLDHLEELGSIKNVIESKTELIKSSGDSQSKQLLNKISELNTTVNHLKQDFNKVSSNFNAYRSKENSRTNTNKDKFIEPVTPEKKPTFLNKVNNLFRSNKNSEVKSKTKQEKQTKNDSNN